MKTDMPACEHVHITKQGILVKCYHKCRTQVLSVGFWAGMTLGYPLEHGLYDHVFPFTWIAKVFGLH